MSTTELLRSDLISVYAHRCTLGPADKPFVEVHNEYSLGYVRRGAFSCDSLGKSFELVAGSIMVGQPGDEFMCSHEHHVCGDDCLGFSIAPELADELAGKSEIWRTVGVPPLAETMVVGELAQAAADGASDIALDEAGLMFAGRFAQVASGVRRDRPQVAARDRRRIIDAALRIASCSDRPLNLARVAKDAGVSSFHFLRLFAAVLGVTPHQYLVRSRLRHAARLLAADRGSISDIAFDVGFGDLSNFVRTFKRAAGLSPRAFRKAAKGDRATACQRLMQA